MSQIRGALDEFCVSLASDYKINGELLARIGGEKPRGCTMVTALDDLSTGSA